MEYQPDPPGEPGTPPRPVLGGNEIYTYYSFVIQPPGQLIYYDDESPNTDYLDITITLTADLDYFLSVQEANYYHGSENRIMSYLIDPLECTLSSSTGSIIFSPTSLSHTLRFYFNHDFMLNVMTEETPMRILLNVGEGSAISANAEYNIWPSGSGSTTGILGNDEINEYYSVFIDPLTITYLADGTPTTNFVSVTAGFKYINDSVRRNEYWSAVTASNSDGLPYRTFGFSLDPSGAVLSSSPPSRLITFSHQLDNFGNPIESNLIKTFFIYLNHDYIKNSITSYSDINTYLKITAGGPESPITAEANYFLETLIQGNGVKPFWENDYPLAASSDRTHIFQFRKDMRNALLDAIDGKVREVFLQHWNEMLSFQDPTGWSQINWDPAAFSSSERTRLIDAMVVDLQFQMERIYNLFGEDYIQSLYTDVYSSIEQVRNNLNQWINETVTASLQNLQQSEILLNTLQRKVNETTLMSHTISLNNVPLNQINAFLYRTNSTNYWDVTNNLYSLNNQLILDFGQLKNIVGDNKKNYFQSWYIKVVPTSIEISRYTSTQDRIIITDINESDVNILGGTFIDKNGKSYKVVNKISLSDGVYGWLLSESIDRNAIDSNLIFVFNYFEPQLIELNFGWQHNYIPKILPLGITLPETRVIEEPEIVEEVIVTEEEIIEPGVLEEVNKEIW